MSESYRGQLEAAENEGMPVQSSESGKPLTPARSSFETTSLERRVLAHERILQSLIAHMAETEPRFVDRLLSVFSEPMKMARREQDYTDADDYAEEFVRAVVELGRLNRAKVTKSGSDLKTSPRDSSRAGNPGQPTVIKDHGVGVTPPPVQITNRSGIWEVKVNGRFYGDYVRRDDAVEAAELAERDLRS